ncbi:hypothetical protein Tco_1086932 [Tanacetum coccineum]
MVDLIQNNLTLEERLDKQGTRLYNLENLNIPHKVSQAVDEIVTDAVDWAMQAPLRARFRDLPTTDMKEILQQRMFEDDSYKAHTVHNDLYEALQKSLELDYSNQRASIAPITSRVSGSSQLPPPPPPPYTGTSGSAQQQGSKAPSLSKTLSPNDSLMQDDSIPEEQVHLSDDEDSENDHQSKADSRKDWWKTLPEEERPATLEPTWTIPSSNKSDTKDTTTFMKWYYQQVNKIELTQADFKGQAYEVVKAFYPDVIHLQFQMEECHTMLTDQVDWANPKGDQVINVNRPLPLGGPPMPEQMWIDDVCTYDVSAKYGISHWWFTRQKFYIDKHDSPSRQKDVRTHMRILSVVRIKAYSRYGYDYLSKIVLRRADHQEHTIAEKDFKNMYPSDFEDLNLLLLQGHLDHLSGSDKHYQLLSSCGPET